MRALAEQPKTIGRLKKRIGYISLILFFVFCASTAPLFAATTTWDGSESDAWSDPDNWSNGVPTSGDDADVPTGNPSITTGSEAAQSLDIYGGSTVYMSGGELATGNVTIAATGTGNGAFEQSDGEHTVTGTLTLGGTTDATASYTLYGGTLNVLNLIADIDEGTGNPSTRFEMDAGTALNVADTGTIDFSAVDGLKVVTVDIDVDAHINMEGSSTLAGPGGCGAYNPLGQVSGATGSTDTTTMSSGLTSMVSLTVGDGTLSGSGTMNSVNLLGIEYGSYRPLTQLPETTVTYQGIETLHFFPAMENPGDTYEVYVPEGSYNGVTMLVLGNGTGMYSTLANVDYILEGNIGNSLSDAPYAVILGTDEVQAYSNLNMNGKDIIAKYGVAVGYFEGDYTSGGTATMGAGASITAGTLIAVDTYSTITMTSSSTMAVGTTTGLTGDIIVGAGGTLRVNGSLTADGHSVVVGDADTAGGTVKGAGMLTDIVLTVQNGGVISPGSSPGTMILQDSSGTLGPGGILEWEVADATGAAGTAWDQWQLVDSTLNITATSENPFTIEIYGWDTDEDARGDPDVFDV